MLPGHNTNGAPRKSNMVAFPLLKWRGMAGTIGATQRPTLGGYGPKLSSQQRRAILIYLMAKLIPKKGVGGNPHVGKSITDSGHCGFGLVVCYWVLIA